MYGKDVGASMAYQDASLDFGLPNGVGPQVSAMKAAGVDMVVSCMDLNGSKTLAQEMARQGMGAVPILHLNMYDQQFVKDAGSLFDGDYVLAQFRPFEAHAGDSTLDTFKQWMAKAGKPISEIAMVGWINADEAYQGIKAAGTNFTRQSVVDATNQMTHYTADGLVQPIDWTRQHEPTTVADPTAHGPKYDCMNLVTVVGGDFHLVGDPSKPWTCWPGDTSAWSEPTHMDFK
jgi:ABC-type branched-subunit amino acid transport system substrate-binding protein